MRRNFAQVLKSAKIDIKREYSRLYSLFYDEDDRDGNSLADLISANFKSFNFRGTCLDLDEFDQEYGFNFVEQPKNFNLDYLVSFCEYVYNFVIRFDESYFFRQINKHFYLQQIDKVIESIGYTQSIEDGFTIFVPKDSVAMAVSKSEHIPENASYKVIAYNHHSMKGNLDSKRQTLLVLADLFEPKRKEINKIDKQLETDLFYAFNNFNIRHNNIEPTGTKYKKPVADLTKEQLEQTYDDTYQMCLLAFMQLDNLEIKGRFEELKNKIETKK